jgi:hypothetical protein
MRNNEVVLDEVAKADITSDQVFWIGIIIGHIISAGACCVLPCPAILTYFLAPTVGSFALSALDHMYFKDGYKYGPPTECTKLGVGMFASPVVPIAMAADYTYSLYTTVRDFVETMEIRKEYAILSLKMKLEELENDWVVMGGNSDNNNNNNCKQQLVLSRRNCNDMCEDDDFVVV